MSTSKKSFIKLLFLGLFLINVPSILFFTNSKVSLIEFSHHATETRDHKPLNESLVLLTFDKTVFCTFDKVNLESLVPAINSINGFRSLGEIRPGRAGLIECFQEETFQNKPRLFRSVFVIHKSALWVVGLYGVYMNILTMFGLICTMTLLFILKFLIKQEKKSLDKRFIFFFIVTSLYSFYLTESTMGFLDTAKIIFIIMILRVLYQAVIIASAFEKRMHIYIVLMLHVAVLAEYIVFNVHGQGTNGFYHMISQRLFPLSIIFYVLSIKGGSTLMDDKFKKIFHLWFFLQIAALLCYFSIYLNQIFTPAFLAVSSIYIGRIAILGALKTREEKILAEARLRVAEQTNQSLLRMAHDLKSPISGISLYLSERESSLSDELGSIFKSCFIRLQEIVKHSLDYSKVSRAEKVSLRSIEVMVNCLIKEYSSRAKFHLDFSHAGIANEVMFISESNLTRAFANIISNSIEAQTEKPEIVIKTATTDGFVLIEFQDNGPGIDENVINAIMNSKPITTKPSGSGIGLSSIKALLNESGGFLDLKNNLGKGVTIGLFLKTC